MSNDVQNLIRQAFHIAKKNGKPDWQQMTVAVLKNRLIQLSGGTFKEENFGSSSFREFVQKQDNLLRLDTSTSPATVMLIDHQLSDASDEPPPYIPSSGAIRPDLWESIIDFSSGKSYVWDLTKKVAREALPEENINLLPTIKPNELTEWRKEFADRHIDTLKENAQERLKRWQSESLGTSILPIHLRGPWNDEIKSKVEQRLKTWFINAGLEMPPLEQTTIKRTDANPDLADLRAIIISCVQVMTREELEQFRLPPAAVLRARTKASS